MKININPYSTIENKSFGVSEVVLDPETFKDVVYKEGKMVVCFSYCYFESLTIRNSQYIEFEDITFSFSYCVIKNLDVESLHSKQVSLNLHGCIVNGNVKSSVLQNISLNNCITPSFFMQNQNSINISYTEENIFASRWKKVLKLTNIDSIEKALSMKQSLYINNAKNINIRGRHNKKKERGLYRDKNSRDRINYYLSDAQKQLLNINISIDFSKQNDERTTVSECILSSLSLTGTAKGQTIIENSKINNIYIHEFSTSADILLYNISPYSDECKFEIRKSNMDNSWFDNISFNSYNILSFFRTRFAKASFISCNFPQDSLSFESFKTLKNVHYPDEKSQNYYKDQYETFLQLRKSLEASGNYHEAQKLSAISKESLRLVSDISKWDKFILWVFKMSNNHGLSIKRPLFGLIGFSLVFYLLYLLSINRLFIDTKFDWSLVGHYFSFLDLTHRKNFLISKEEFTIWTLTIDFFNKILVGFFIFQFISAFRKYVKN